MLEKCFSVENIASEARKHKRKWKGNDLSGLRDTVMLMRAFT
jgi:hypothetical protein